ncbi:uncharacterized protein LOC131658409 [Vicia villosa]|uniref:uncharacterized protein LOC131658409 n=1 Tax=Vicia villosa TaxID=3911 RepID=UPI00273AF818|nr:uncharacterized protein LOC131658409 [Vicia villosa]
MEEIFLEAKENLIQLEIQGENTALPEEELVIKRDTSTKQHDLKRLNCKIQWQKARSRWLKEEDANTKYFHSFINKRRKDNEILSQLVNERRITEAKEMKNEIFEDFRRHYSAGGVRVISENINFKIIGAEHIVNLVQEFSEAEVRRAVWECDGDKSPGPDELNFGFLKEFWDEIKHDFMRLIAEFHENERLVKGANNSFVILIPKKRNMMQVSNYRPISFIGCIYKVLYKVLTNIIKKVISMVISEPQSAFISGNQILDGILFANEIVDGARKQKKC